MATAFSQAKEAAAQAVRDVCRLSGPDDINHTATYRRLAERLVDLRAYFTTEDGEPDYTGRTHAYRRAVADVFGMADVPPSERSAIQATVRYHVGFILRERLTPEQLTQYGLKAETPAERNRQLRARNSALLQALRGGEPEGKTGIDALRSLQAAKTLLMGIAPEAWETMPAGTTRLTWDRMAAEVSNRAALLSGNPNQRRSAELQLAAEQAARDLNAIEDYRKGLANT